MKYMHASKTTFSQVFHGNTDDDTDDDMAEHDVELLPDLKPRVLVVLRDFVSSSSMDASSPSFADITPLLNDMSHDVCLFST